MQTPVLLKLRDGFDAPRMLAEVNAAREQIDTTIQTGPYHNGRWQRLGLYGPGGDHIRYYARKGERPEKTAPLKLMPTVEAMLDSLPGTIRSASVSAMQPGGYLRWHRDVEQSVDIDQVRLHLPIKTSKDAVLQLGHHSLTLPEGELWYGDFSFPHRVWNKGGEDRIHIMIVLENDDAAKTLFPAEFLSQAQRRRIARKLSGRSFDFSEKLHAEGRYAARYRRERQATLQNGEIFDPKTVGMGGKFAND